MTAPEHPAWPESARLSTGDEMSAGDPRLFAPEVMERLTRMERKHVGRAYEAYLQKHGGFYWSVESRRATPASMARKILGHGVWGASWTKTVPIVILFVYIAGALFMDGSPIAIAIGVVCVVTIPWRFLIALRRQRRVLSWFDQAHKG